MPFARLLNQSERAASPMATIPPMRVFAEWERAPLVVDPPDAVLEAAEEALVEVTLALEPAPDVAFAGADVEGEAGAEVRVTPTMAHI